MYKKPFQTFFVVSFLILNPATIIAPPHGCARAKEIMPAHISQNHFSSGNQSSDERFAQIQADLKTSKHQLKETLETVMQKKNHDIDDLSNKSQALAAALLSFKKKKKTLLERLFDCCCSKLEED